jgi:hypothetical protein
MGNHTYPSKGASGFPAWVECHVEAGLPDANLASDTVPCSAARNAVAGRGLAAWAQDPGDMVKLP